MAPFASRLSRFSPNAITLAGLLVGLAAAGAAGAAWYRTALVLWLLNRLIDGLDGLVAREHNRATDFGGYLDVMADFLVYAALPICIYLSRPGSSGALSLIAMLGSFYVNAASWMYLSAILEKRGAGARALGDVTTVTMPPGLIGATETILFYAAFLIRPEWMSELFALMAVLVAVGVGQRVWWARKNLSHGQIAHPSRSRRRR